MKNTIEILTTLTTEEINEAMKQVKATDKAKARATKAINDYKEIKATFNKLFH